MEEKREMGNEEEILLMPDEEHKSPVDETTDQAETVTLEKREKQNRTYAVTELMNGRETNVKVFQMSDNREQAVIFAEPVHTYNTQEARYVEIDNSLVEEAEGRYYRNGKSYFTAKFSREAENDELFHLEKDQYKLNVSLKRTARLRNGGVEPRLMADTQAAEAKSRSLLYENLFADTDFVYSVSGAGVKEDIVIREKKAAYRYAFLLRSENLRTVFSAEDRSVKFYSTETDEEIFEIPAPFMTDAAGAVSSGVSYEVKEAADGAVILSILADSDWINAEERAFPVTIDPQVIVSGANKISTYSWKDGYMYRPSTHLIASTASASGCCNTERMYMYLTTIDIPDAPKISKAELTVYQDGGDVDTSRNVKVGLYRVTQDFTTGCCTPINDSALIDYCTLKNGHLEDGEVIQYTFDVTALLDDAENNQSTAKLVFKLMDEEDGESAVRWYGGANSQYAPKLVVTYESGFAVNLGSGSAQTHDIGRFGTGSVDLQRGNLMFACDDFNWSGNRMPVSIKHYYTSTLYRNQYTSRPNIGLKAADFSNMKVGCGWRLNYMQSMIPDTFAYDGETYDGYVYVGEDGSEMYFKLSNAQEHKISHQNSDGTDGSYYLYIGVDNDGVTYDPVKRELNYYSRIYHFDSAGRLDQICDEYGNKITLTYTAGRLTSIVDGAGREFALNYSSDGYLTSIEAPAASVTSPTESVKICYAYKGDGYLSAITYPDGQKTLINPALASSGIVRQVLLQDAAGNSLYRMDYTYHLTRVSSICEYGFEGTSAVKGQQTDFAYSIAARRSSVTTTEPADGAEGEKTTKLVYAFDDEGNIISSYTTTGDGSVASGGMMSNTSRNLLLNHGFEGLDHWNMEAGNDVATYISCYEFEPIALYGKSSLRIDSMRYSLVGTGVYQVVNSLEAGEYTASAYIQLLNSVSGASNVTNPGGYICVTTLNGTVLAESEHVSRYSLPNEYERVSASFKLDTAQAVRFCIRMDGSASMTVDGAQLEKNPYPSPYNLLVNGGFEKDICYGWPTYTAGASIDYSTRFNGTKSLHMTGKLDSQRFACQKVLVKSDAGTRETFTLSGWAKGYGLPDHARDNSSTPIFRLRAEIVYEDNSRESHNINFSPCTEEWQFVSGQFTKAQYKAVGYINIYCEYDHNAGEAFFDDIQLVRDNIDYELKASDLDNNYLSYPNVEDEAKPVYKETQDQYGNFLTDTIFNDGEFGTLYRSFEYNDTDTCNNCLPNAGNDLTKKTDERGNVTAYTVNPETSKNEAITDRCGNKTEYLYDDTGKKTKVTVRDKENHVLSSKSYVYNCFGQTSEITRGDGLKYDLSYNAYHKLDNISINGESQSLLNLTYKNGNGRVKSVTYANGSIAKISYNGLGQVVSEKWYNPSNILEAYYKYVYGNDGSIVSSIDMIQLREYNYIYKAQKKTCAVEYSITLGTNDYIIKKVPLSKIYYRYNRNGVLTSKCFVDRSGNEKTWFYSKNSHNSPIVTFEENGQNIVSHAKSDSFGRKVFDEIQLSTGFVSRQFDYHVGQVSTKHIESNSLKSSATTKLVKSISFSDGRTISYEYDEEERVVKMTDSIDGVTAYTYDALGQLLTETHDGVAVSTMTYDGYGNILTKNGVSYQYDTVWKDKLTRYGDESITYDPAGNPLAYRGFTFTWEKGRQLKGAVRDGDTYSYTYNAAGIRTTKTINNIEHRYTLEGTRIIEERFDNHSIKPLYDCEETICGIDYDGSRYYFFKNLQGDIIAIVDDMSNVVARYHYDAWGVCTIDCDTSEVGIASINPYRYRGYYFDAETELYYLQSRYYDPVTGRFINADGASFIEKIDYNLYAYCKNNPIMYNDPTGYCSEGPAFTLEGPDLSSWFEYSGTFTVEDANNYALMLDYIRNQSKDGYLEKALKDLALTISVDVVTTFIIAELAAAGISMTLPGSITLSVTSALIWGISSYRKGQFENDLDELAYAIRMLAKEHGALNIYFLYNGSSYVKICKSYNNETLKVFNIISGYTSELALAAMFHKDPNDPKSREDPRPNVSVIIVGRNVDFHYHY